MQQLYHGNYTHTHGGCSLWWKCRDNYICPKSLSALVSQSSTQTKSDWGCSLGT